tara:strand:+ start:1753 stop:1986 length:234 start_codon:yes stop_codon:yes gene_type:complete
MAASTGCVTCGSRNNGCYGGGNGAPPATSLMGKLHRGSAVDASQMQAGPATAAYSYPYYTTRGPRDFLVDDPPSIGR